MKQLLARVILVLFMVACGGLFFVVPMFLIWGWLGIVIALGAILVMVGVNWALDNT